MKNYYEILEVDKNASIQVIKGVYKIHIKKKHPDLFQGEEKLKAEEEIKLLNEAYETLVDENKRKEYDEMLAEQEKIDKELYEEVLRENETLKEIIDNTKENTQIEIDKNITPKDFEYDPRVTEENNTKYLMKLIWKERILRFVIFVTIFIAAVVGIYKASGINILESFLNSVVRIFGGNS